MTLETARRLVAAVANLAAFLKNDPEFSDVLGADADAANVNAERGSISDTESPSIRMDSADASSLPAANRQTTVSVGTHVQHVTMHKGAQQVSVTITVVEESSGEEYVIESSTGSVDSAVADTILNASPADEAADAVLATIGSSATLSTKSFVPPSSEGVRLLLSDSAASLMLVQPVAQFQYDTAMPQVLTYGLPALQINTADSRSQSGDSDNGQNNQEEQGATAQATDSLAIALPVRTQGYLPAPPFNRRLETNGVDELLIMERVFSTASNAYAGRDGYAVIQPISAPHMRTDGGAALPPESQPEETVGETNDKPVRFSRAPVIIVIPQPEPSPPIKWRRRTRVAVRHEHLHVRPVRIQARTNFSSPSTSDPCSIGGVECAVCWVAEDTARRPVGNSS